MIRKLLIASGLALVLGAPVAQAAPTFTGGLQIDPTGGGNVVGSLFFDQLTWRFGDALMDGMVAPSATGTFYAQSAAYIDAAHPEKGVITYQVILPASTVGVPNGVKVTQAAGAATFAMYFDPTPELSTGINTETTGVGYGDLHGSTLGADQVLIASGTATFSNAFLVTESDSTVSALASNRPDVGTTVIGGRVTVYIDLGSTNPDYVVNDVTAASVDMNIASIGLQSPYDSKPAALSVVGETPDFGTVDTSSATTSAYSSGMNSFDCGSSPTYGQTCDMQFQTAASSKFNGARVPEPASLALTGLGLGLLGLMGSLRRRARTSA